MATEKTQQQAQQPLPLENPAQQPPQQPQQAAGPQPNAPVPAKPKKNAVDKSLVVATLNTLHKDLAPLTGCFDNAWGSFVKAYGDGAGQVMAQEIDFAAQAMLSNNFLIKCAYEYPDDFVNSIKNLALTGFTLNPVLKQGYLVPFKHRITFMPSYMGLIDVLVNNGLVSKIEAHPVFEGEKFEIVQGTGGYLKHSPDPWGKKEVSNLKGVYYFVVLVDGTEVYDTLSAEEIEKIRQRAPSAKGETSPWDTDYLEMAKKTAIRRAFKTIPKRGISSDKLKAVGVAFDYDEKVSRSYYDELKKAVKNAPFEEEEAEYTEIK